MGQSEQDRRDRSEAPKEAPTRAEFLRLPEWIAKRIYPTVIVIVLILLVLHTSGWDQVDVDTTSVALVGLLLLLPVVHAIRRFKVGNFFEAEIELEDVQRLRAEAAELPAPAGDGAEAEDILDVTELVRRDPVLGLAKLRIELETELRRRYEAIRFDPAVPAGARQRADRHIGATIMLRDLVEAGRVPPEIASPLEEVLHLANRAVHGDYVRADHAREIAAIGVRCLEALRAEQPHRFEGDAPPE